MPGEPVQARNEDPFKKACDQIIALARKHIIAETERLYLCFCHQYGAETPRHATTGHVEECRVHRVAMKVIESYASVARIPANLSPMDVLSLIDDLQRENSRLIENAVKLSQRDTDNLQRRRAAMREARRKLQAAAVSAKQNGRHLSIAERIETLAERRDAVGRENVRLGEDNRNLQDELARALEARVQQENQRRENVETITELRREVNDLQARLERAEHDAYEYQLDAAARLSEIHACKEALAETGMEAMKIGSKFTLKERIDLAVQMIRSKSIRKPVPADDDAWRPAPTHEGWWYWRIAHPNGVVTNGLVRVEDGHKLGGKQPWAVWNRFFYVSPEDVFPEHTRFAPVPDPPAEPTQERKAADESD